MLKLIEEDADSFAKRAEMYYKKRPELINIVEDLYRTHRSLAEKYDQVKFDSGNRNLTPWTSCPLPLSQLRNSHFKESEKSFDSYSESKFRTSQLIKESEKAYDSYSESFDYDHDYESGESVVIDDLEQEHELEHEEYNDTQVDEETEELMKLKEEVERLKEENKIQREQLVQKDDEKREAIRQLSFSVDFLKQENTNLKTRIANETFKKQNNSNSSPFEFTKLKGAFWGRLFNGVVPL